MKRETFQALRNIAEMYGRAGQPVPWWDYTRGSLREPDDCLRAKMQSEFEADEALAEAKRNIGAPE